ncbi:MAG: NusA-like transcription termination signal-binding factor [Candidatus Aenigmatarchaeota archaeon]
MKLILDATTIQNIKFFEDVTGSSVMDCLDEGSEIYFIVAEGQYGFCVGRGGEKIRNAERLFKKSIKIFEYSPNIDKFIKNMIPETTEIIKKENVIEIRVKSSERARIIGKAGKNIKLYNKFMKRLFSASEMKIK